MLLRDRKVIVTGGPTREWIDPVRFISNPSTGKMGLALARCALSRSRETVFIHGPMEAALLARCDSKQVVIESTGDLLRAVTMELEEDAILIMAAAPADYTPVKAETSKIKKSGKGLVLHLTGTPDILKEVAALKAKGKFPGLVTIGFAAETDDIEAHARAKLSRKDLDMICLNDVKAAGAGFGTDTNIITIFTRTGDKIELPVLSKDEAALRIFDAIEGIFAGHI